MAFETGRWLVDQGWVPSLILTTPTARTRQTTEELQLALGAAVLVEERGLPELLGDLADLLEALAARRPALSVVVCVGHHPMMDLLKREHPPAVEIPRTNFASAIALEVSAPGVVQAVSAWAGRPSW
jgi:phosphohistidine phosphatase SixA